MSQIAPEIQIAVTALEDCDARTAPEVSMSRLRGCGLPAGNDLLDDHVQPNTSYTYTWYVTDRAAPGEADGSSVVWMYHSHTHEIQDSYAGLMGAIVVTRPVC